MAKKFILIALVILGSSIYSYQNESRATDTISSASGSGTNYAGKAHRQRSPYRIVSSRYVSRSSVRKSIDHHNGVRIKLMQNGLDNTDIEDLSLAYDSGTEYRMGNVYGIDNTLLPLYVKVTYRSWNTFHAVQLDVTYEFVIYSPGTWDVTINN